MIEQVHGNLLNAEAEALVNTVNCVGVMGKGIALQFKQAYPDMDRFYQRACERGEVVPGRMLVWQSDQFAGPRYVINFPTKRHWMGKSRYEDIQAGLEALIHDVTRLSIRSIALPPLGCGHGGLDWGKVRPMIENAFAAVPEVRVLLFAPAGAPPTGERLIRTRRPRMTRARAMLLLSLQRYAVLAYETTQLEIQKLAYFLQEAGESLRLQFTPQRYGPYAESLNKVLEMMEGHFLSGFDGERSPARVIAICDSAAEEAAHFLDGDEEAYQRLERLGRLIEGFETPYGMELLSSVHWVAMHAESPARSSDEAVAAVHAWTARKAARFHAEHIVTAWNQLVEQDWIQ